MSYFLNSRVSRLMLWLTNDLEYKSFVVRDRELLNELFDYIFKEKGIGTIRGSKADLGTGALERHGDRVIAAALCVLACKEQVAGNFEEARVPPPNSFMRRYKQWEAEENSKRKDRREYLF